MRTLAISSSMLLGIGAGFGTAQAQINEPASTPQAFLDRVAARNPNPGRPALHRLNRTEYANAIRDLLALDIDADELLPGDDSSFGFDNVAGSLGISPVLIERYADAAAKISRLAVGDSGIAADERAGARVEGINVIIGAVVDNQAALNREAAVGCGKGTNVPTSSVNVRLYSQILRPVKASNAQLKSIGPG